MQRALSVVSLLVVSSLPALAQVSVWTQRYDNLRTGANMNETVLTTANVNSLTFGKLFSMPVDGFVFAQPLLMPNVAVLGATKHDVLYVATAHDSVYGFDADTGARLLYASLGTFVPSTVIGTSNIRDAVGIIGSPVIDQSTNTLYVVTKTYEKDEQIFRVHALDITSLKERAYSPKVVTASVRGMGVENNGYGTVMFEAAQENQRPALTLVDGVVYIAFASHDDSNPYHGWVLAYNKTNLSQIAAFNDSPNSSEGGIWMSGQGLVVDAANNVYLMTGNTTPDSDYYPSDLGESFVKLTLSGGTLAAADYFRPNNYDYLNSIDGDLGSGGPVGIPGTPYVVGGGKQGIFYLVDTTNMGKLNLQADRCRQEFQADHGLFGSPAFWNNATTPMLFSWGRGAALTGYAYSYSRGLFNTVPALVSAQETLSNWDSSASVSVSSNGSKSGSGIVWATMPLGEPGDNTVPGRLYAFNATSLKELFDSDQVKSRDDYGNYAKFVAPVVANGKVYVSTDSNAVCAYGLFPRQSKL